MGSSSENTKTAFDSLIAEGNLLLFALIYETIEKDEESTLVKKFKEIEVDVSTIPDFDTSYEVWYSKAFLAVKNFVPERLNDFVLLYKNDKRKQVDHLTYTISDAIIGVETSRGYEKLTSRKTAIPKMQQQVSILQGTAKLVDSVFYALQFSIRADLFDSELDAAKELLKAGFYRAVGAMCGVILEKHLFQVCVEHDVLPKKKGLTINDYNEALKNSDIIDLPTWRFVQMLGDLRNLCCHDKSDDPTQEQANDMLDGTTKIIKTVF